ncbi:hypothetical protein ABEL47_22800 [Escherichia coli]
MKDGLLFILVVLWWWWWWLEWAHVLWWWRHVMRRWESYYALNVDAHLARSTHLFFR